MAKGDKDDRLNYAWKVVFTGNALVNGSVVAIAPDTDVAAEKVRGYIGRTYTNPESWQIIEICKLGEVV